MNKSLAQLRSLIPEEVAQYWEKKKLEKLDVIEMAVEHLTRIRSVSTCSSVTCSNVTCSNVTCSSVTCSNGSFTTGYRTCLKAVLDYFQMTPLHCTSVSVPHLVSYLEHRLTNPFSSGQDQITRHPSPSISHQSQPRPSANRRPLSSCEYERSEEIIRWKERPANLLERSGSPEKRRRSGENQPNRATPDSPCSLSSPSPNIANLTIADTPPPLVDLVTSRSSSSATESTGSEERRRSTSFKKVLKERYLGSRSE